MEHSNDENSVPASSPRRGLAEIRTQADGSVIAVMWADDGASAGLFDGAGRLGVIYSAIRDGVAWWFVFGDAEPRHESAEDAIIHAISLARKMGNTDHPD